jgi:curved DNA-binding protein CbpA
MSGDLYELLGIKKTASNAEIDKAFKKLLVTCHPDKLKNPTEKEKEIANQKLMELY